jgi:hypothetical protein
MFGQRSGITKKGGRKGRLGPDARSLAPGETTGEGWKATTAKPGTVASGWLGDVGGGG